MNGPSSAPWSRRSPGVGRRFLGAVALAVAAIWVAIPLTSALVQSALKQGEWFMGALIVLGPPDLLALGLAAGATFYAVKTARTK